MAHFNRGISTVLSLGAIILLILSATFFAQQHASSGIYLSRRHVSGVADPLSSGIDNSILAAHLKTKTAHRSGHEAALRHNVLGRSNDTRRALMKRVLSFDEAVERGTTYWNAIQNPASHVETPWRDLNDLVGTDVQNPDYNYGWSKRDGGDGYIYQNAFDTLNIPKAPSYNRKILLDQDRRYITCGERREATQAKCHGTYNLEGKTIVSQDVVSPNYQLRFLYDVDHLDAELAAELPRVGAWSDLVWIAWSSVLAGPDEPSKLKYIFRHHIVTPDTVAVIEDIFGLDEGQIPAALQWPGVVVRPGSQHFLALLGTPHGRGVAYLLVQHPGELELGGKSIESITVFTVGGQAEDEWHLLFTLTGEGN